MRLDPARRMCKVCVPSIGNGNGLMAGSINKVILVGRLGRDPEIRMTQDGRKIANFSVATSETWRDRNTQERRERTEWHRVVIFNEFLVRISEDYLKKGSQVYIEGQLQTRKWTDQQGQERYSTEVVLQNYRGELTMLGGRGDREDVPRSDYDRDRSHAPAGQPMGGGDRYGGGSSYGDDRGRSSGSGSGYDPMPGPVGGPDDLDDEIPF